MVRFRLLNGAQEEGSGGPASKARPLRLRLDVNAKSVPPNPILRPGRTHDPTLELA